MVEHRTLDPECDPLRPVGPDQLGLATRRLHEFSPWVHCDVSTSRVKGQLRSVARPAAFVGSSAPILSGNNRGMKLKTDIT